MFLLAHQTKLIGQEFSQLARFIIDISRTGLLKQIVRGSLSLLFSVTPQLNVGPPGAQPITGIIIRPPIEKKTRIHHGVNHFGKAILAGY